MKNWPFYLNNLTLDHNLSRLINETKTKESLMQRQFRAENQNLSECGCEESWDQHIQPLREDTKIRTQSTKSALSDRLN